MGNPKRKLIFQPSIFRGELLNFQGVVVFWNWTFPCKKPLKPNDSGVTWPSTATGSAENIERKCEVGGVSREICRGGESELKEVARSETKVIAALHNAFGESARPRSRAAFEANNGHVRGDAPGNPTAELRRSSGFRENTWGRSRCCWKLPPAPFQAPASYMEAKFHGNNSTISTPSWWPTRRKIWELFSCQMFKLIWWSGNSSTWKGSLANEETGMIEKFNTSFF